MRNKLQAIVNRNVRDYFQLGTRVNILRINRSASLEHELLKAELFTKLRFQGHAVVCEGVLKNKQQPDLTIVDLEKPIIYEIGVTEKSLRKTKEYPFKVTFIKVRGK